MSWVVVGVDSNERVVVLGLASGRSISTESLANATRDQAARDHSDYTWVTIPVQPGPLSGTGRVTATPRRFPGFAGYDKQLPIQSTRPAADEQLVQASSAAILESQEVIDELLE